MIVRRAIRIRLGGIAALCAVASFVLVTMLPAATGDTIADREVGEPDFLHSCAVDVNGVSPDNGTGNGYGLSAVTALAIDSAGHLYAADTANNRVLGWHDEAALVTGQSADLVVGQVDLYSISANGNGGPNPNPNNLASPEGVAVDSNDNLYVADTSNNRVLEYSAPYTACGGVLPCTVGPPNLVFGQLDDFYASDCNLGGFTVGTSADSLCGPRGIAVDSHDNLYVADNGNNRVLEYNTPLTVTAVSGSGDTTADFVFGEGASGTNFNTSAVTSCLTITPSATNLCSPFGVAVDSSGNVYVSDTNYDRVLVYNQSGTPPTNATADAALGVAGPSSGGSCILNSQNGICNPHQLAFDASNNLYVGTGRVLEFATPITNNENASAVFGQPNFTTIDTSCGAANVLCSADGVAIDASGNLLVGDTTGNRIMEFKTPLLTENESASLVLGQGGFNHLAANTAVPEFLALPIQIAIDRKSTPIHLYVADSFDHRILAWNDVATFTDGAAADLVIGQPDFYSNSANEGSGTSTTSSLADPQSVAVDSNSNLYVADTGNNRVLEFSAPFAGCASLPCVDSAAATVVIGLQGSSTDECAGTPSAMTLCGPDSVAIDSNNNLYVADTQDNRVLEFLAPLSTNEGASGVWGQAGSFSTNGQNNPSGTPSANSLFLPEGVALDPSNNLYISDLLNNRVLEFNETANPATNTTANTVFGQTNFSNNGSGGGTTGLNEPRQVTLDQSGNLFIVDWGNSRVLQYSSPATSNTTPVHVFGQADDLNGSRCNFDGGEPDAATLCSPQGVAVDGIGDVAISDTLNNRVLWFDQPLAATPTPTPTATATGRTPTATPTATASSSPSSTSSRTPTATATPSATASPSPTATQTPTPTPTPTGVPITLAYPQNVSFGTSTLVGKTSKPAKVSLKNSNSKKSHLSAVIMMETATAPFAVKSQCHKTLAPGKSCKVLVTFAPQNTRPQTGMLMIYDDVVGSPQLITLTGTGKAGK
jgi:sugar lactone lactonase YvrE